MRFPIPEFIRVHPIFSLASLAVVLGIGAIIHESFKVSSHVPAFLVGVHHLSSDHYINRFYVNESISDNIGEGGGGGSKVCCLSLPRKWNPSLVADVRWEVHHILRATEENSQDTGEVEGVYRAQVPIESYIEPGDFYVHFFPDKRVRIVVSPVPPSNKRHPVQRRDSHAAQKSTLGYQIKALFTDEELAERRREYENYRKKHGGWR